MGIVNGRLTDLERRIAQVVPEHCGVCVDWPPTRVVYRDGGHETTDDPRPARCPSCGRERLTITVTYGEEPHPGRGEAA